MMKTTNTSKIYLLSFLALILIPFTGFSQVQELRSFDRIVVSPRVELELVKGDKESIRLEYKNIDENKVNVKVKGNTLRIYLDEAKVIVKNSKRGRYYDKYGDWDRTMYPRNVRVKAYVTYTDLKYLQIRGTQDVDIKSPVASERFKLKAYGETHINVASIKADKFKAVLIGENRLDIKEGETKKQKYKSIGENWVRADGLESRYAKANFIGEGRVKLKVDDRLRVSAIGEAEVIFTGNPIVHRGLVIGENRIRKDW